MCTNASVIRPYRPSPRLRGRKGLAPRAIWRGACFLVGAGLLAAFAFLSRIHSASSRPLPAEPLLSVPAAESEDWAARSIAELAAWSYYGDASASFELGRRLEFGIGTDPDYSEAAHWYATAEEQGHPLPPRVLSRLFP